MPDETFYDLKTARAALPWVKKNISKLKELGTKGKQSMSEYDLDSADSYTREIHSILDKINKKGIRIRDLEHPLIDFPVVINNIPAYLCWEPDEEDIHFWHYADEGFAGRKRITGEENILSYL